jgi:hypothetical protein
VIIAMDDRYNPFPPRYPRQIAQQKIGRVDICKKSSVQWCHGFAEREDSSSEQPRHTREVEQENSNNDGIKVYRHAKFSYTNNLVHWTGSFLDDAMSTEQQYRYIASIFRRRTTFAHPSIHPFTHSQKKTGVGHGQRGKSTEPIAQPGVFFLIIIFMTRTAFLFFFFFRMLSLPRSCITLKSCVVWKQL